MKQKKSTENANKKKTCMMKELKNRNDLFLLSGENWNSQDSRNFIMNADFRQMDSARSDK